MKEYLFEVCANSVESCIAAQAGGANRVELCAGIPEGGTTPSYGDIVIAREVLQNTRLHVIIRPRSGDFLYSPIEQRIMLKDIDNARRLGADGIVLGCLTADGEVDIPLMKQFMEAALTCIQVEVEPIPEERLLHIQVIVAPCATASRTTIFQALRRSWRTTLSRA